MENLRIYYGVIPPSKQLCQSGYHSPCFPRSLPLAPPTPRRYPRDRPLGLSVCSPASSLVWQGRSSSGFDSSFSRCGPLRNNVSGQAGDLPVLVQRAYLHARVSDHAGPSRPLALSRLSVLPSATLTASAPRNLSLSRQWLAGRLPLSTLRHAPRDALRMTRSQSGLQFLSC
jgi:hypothetical protein